MRIFMSGVIMLMLLGLCSCGNRKDVTGTWTGSMTLQETGKSLNDLEFNLVQKGSEVTGTMVFTKVDAAKVKLSGNRTDKQIKFVSEYKRGLSLSFSGELTGGKTISGTAILNYNDPKVPVKQDTVTLVLTRK